MGSLLSPTVWVLGLEYRLLWAWRLPPLPAESPARPWVDWFWFLWNVAFEVSLIEVRDNPSVCPSTLQAWGLSVLVGAVTFGATLPALLIVF